MEHERFSVNLWQVKDHLYSLLAIDIFLSFEKFVYFIFSILFSAYGSAGTWWTISLMKETFIHAIKDGSEIEVFNVSSKIVTKGESEVEK